MFEIRQVYVNNPLQKAQGFNRFVTGGVPDEGEGRTPEFQRFKDLRNERGCGDEGDGMDAQIRQPFQGIG